MLATPLCRRRNLLMFALVFSVFSGPWFSANAQLSESNIVFTEFFEELYSLDLANQSVTDILNSPINTPSFQLVEVLDPNTIALTSSDDLYFYDVQSATASFFQTLTFSPEEITRDGSGNLIAVGSPGVVRIDTTTGNETLVFDETFFDADDAVVDSQGNVFVTEFFDALGVVGPNGGFRQIGDFDTNQFSHLDIGVDGALYLASTDGGEFYRVDQSTGTSTLLAEDAFTFIDDLQVADDGSILFGGFVDSENGIFSFDPLTGEVSTVIFEDDVNNGFFNPLDIDIFSSSNRFALTAVPEPSTVSVVALLGSVCLIRRRRGHHAAM